MSLQEESRNVQPSPSQNNNQEPSSIHTMTRVRRWVRSYFFPKTQRELDRTLDPSFAQIDKTPNWFEILAFMVSLANTAVLAAADPKTTTEAERIFDYFDYVFVAFFIVELALRVIAFGFRSIRNSWWHITDVIVVIIGVGGLLLKSVFPQFAPVVNSLRAIRTIRLLKLVGSITEVRIILETLSRCMRKIADIALLYLLFWFAGSALGVGLFKGALSYRCVRREYYNSTLMNETLSDPLGGGGVPTIVNMTAPVSIKPYIEVNSTITTTSVLQMISDTFNETDFVCGGKFETVILGREEPGDWCDLTTACDPFALSEEEGFWARGFICPFEYTCASIGNAKYGFLNYDNFASGLLTTQVLVTFEAWSDVAMAVAGSTNKMSVIYCFLVVLVGSLFMTNLLVALLTMQFDASRSQTLNEQREERAARMARNRTRIRSPGLVERVRGYFDAVMLAQHIRRQLCTMWALMDRSTRAAMKQKWRGQGGNTASSRILNPRYDTQSSSSSPNVATSSQRVQQGALSSSYSFATGIEMSGTEMSLLEEPLLLKSSVFVNGSPLSPPSPTRNSPQGRGQYGFVGAPRSARSEERKARVLPIGRTRGSSQNSLSRVDPQAHDAYDFLPNCTFFEAVRLWYKTDGDFSLASTIPSLTRMIPSTIALRGVDPITIPFDDIGNVVVEDERTVLLFLEQLIAIAVAVTDDNSGGSGGSLSAYNLPAAFSKQNSVSEMERMKIKKGTVEIDRRAEEQEEEEEEGGRQSVAGVGIHSINSLIAKNVNFAQSIHGKTKEIGKMMAVNLEEAVTTGALRQVQSGGGSGSFAVSGSDSVFGRPRGFSSSPRQAPKKGKDESVENRDSVLSFEHEATIENAVHDPSYRNLVLFEADAEEALYQIRIRSRFFAEALNKTPSRAEMIRFGMEHILNRSVTFELVTLVFTCVGVVGQLIQYEGQPPLMERVLNNYLGFACAVLFSIEWVLRMLASHPIAFATQLNSWLTLALCCLEWTALVTGDREYTAARSLRFVAIESTLRFFPKSFRWLMVLKGSLWSSLVVIMLIAVDAIIVALVGLHTLGASFCQTEGSGAAYAYSLESLLNPPRTSHGAVAWYENCEGNPRNNFDTFLEALLTAVQLIAADGWHDTMYRSMRVIDGGFQQAFVAIFFVLHYFLVVMVLLNVFIAILVGATDSLYSTDDDDDEEARKKGSGGGPLDFDAHRVSRYRYVREQQAIEDRERNARLEKIKEKERRVEDLIEMQDVGSSQKETDNTLSSAKRKDETGSALASAGKVTLRDTTSSSFSSSSDEDLHGDEKANGCGDCYSAFATRIKHLVEDWNAQYSRWQRDHQLGEEALCEQRKARLVVATAVAEQRALGDFTRQLSILGGELGEGNKTIESPSAPLPVGGGSEGRRRRTMSRIVQGGPANVYAEMQKAPKSAKWQLQQWIRIQHALFRITPVVTFVRELAEAFLKSQVWIGIEQAAVIVCVVMLFYDDTSAAPDSPRRRIVRLLNTILSIFFAAEITAQILAMGPRRYYFKSLFIHSLCTIAAILGVVEVVLEAAKENGADVKLPSLSAVKIVYVLKTFNLLLRFETIALVWAAVVWARVPLMKVLLVAAVVFIGFCSGGIMLFGGKFGHCDTTSCAVDGGFVVGNYGNSTDHNSKNFACGSQSYVQSNTPSTFPILSVDLTEGCVALGYEWVVNGQNFDNAWSAFEALGLISAVEQWAPIMYAGVDSTSRDNAPRQNNSFAYALYFIIFIFVGNFFLVNLFGSVLIYSFETRREEERRQKALNEDPSDRWRSQVRSVFEAIPIELFLEMDTDMIKRMPPTISVRLRLHRLRRNRWYTRFILFVTVLGALTCLAEFSPCPAWLTTLIMYVYDVHAAILVADSLMGICSLGWQMYFASPTNSFELTVALFLGVDVFLRHFAPSFQFGNAFRCIRLFRIIRSGKMKQRMRDLANRLGKAMSSLAVITCFLFVFVLLASLIANRMFGRLSRTRNGLTPYRNFETIPSSIVLCLAIVVGSDWGDVMAACSVEGLPNCDPNIGNCGYPVLAPLFFFIYVVIGNYCLFSIFVAAIINSFENESELPNAVTAHNVVKFVQAWVALDKHRTFLIKASEFAELLASLPEDHPFKPKPKSSGESMEGFEYVRFTRQLRVFANKKSKIDLVDVLIELTRVNAGERHTLASHASVRSALTGQLRFVYEASAVRRVMQAVLEARQQEAAGVKTSIGTSGDEASRIAAGNDDDDDDGDEETPLWLHVWAKVFARHYRTNKLRISAYCAKLRKIRDMRQAYLRRVQEQLKAAERSKKDNLEGGGIAGVSWLSGVITPTAAVTPWLAHEHSHLRAPKMSASQASRFYNKNNWTQTNNGNDNDKGSKGSKGVHQLYDATDSGHGYYRGDPMDGGHDPSDNKFVRLPPGATATHLTPQEVARLKTNIHDLSPDELRLLEDHVLYSYANSTHDIEQLPAGSEVTGSQQRGIADGELPEALAGVSSHSYVRHKVPRVPLGAGSAIDGNIPSTSIDRRSRVHVSSAHVDTAAALSFQFPLELPPLIVSHDVPRELPRRRAQPAHSNMLDRPSAVSLHTSTHNEEIDPETI